MNKLILIFCVLIFSYKFSFSQDLIVRNNGDSINCKINEVKKGIIRFHFIYKGELRNTLLPLDQVKSYHYNYFPSTSVPTVTKIKVLNNQHWQFCIDGGWAYQLPKISPDLSPEIYDYMKELKTGYQIGGEINYFVIDQMSLGLKYKTFKTSNRIDDIVFYDDFGNMVEGTISDNISITYIGLVYNSYLFNSSKKNAFSIGASIGYLGFKNNFIFIDDFSQSGSTIGFGLQIGYDIGINKNFALGFNLSMINGTLSRYELSDGVNTETIKLPKDNYIGLGRIDLSVAIKYNLSIN